jgi:hypothetical protein
MDDRDFIELFIEHMERLPDVGQRVIVDGDKTGRLISVRIPNTGQIVWRVGYCDGSVEDVCVSSWSSHPREVVAA